MRSTKQKSRCGQFKLCVGSKLQVMRGTAQRTSGGVTKDGLMYNRHGRVVYKSKHEAASKGNNLFKQIALAAAQRRGGVRKSKRRSKRTRRSQK